MGGYLATLFYTRYRRDIKVNTMTYVCCPTGSPLDSFPYAKFLPKDIDMLVDLLSEGPVSKLVDNLETNRSMRTMAYRLSRVMGVGIDKAEFNSMYHSFLGRKTENAIAFRAMHEYGQEIGDMMAEIDIPTLIIASKKDFFVSTEPAFRLWQALDDAEIEIFKESTHAPMLEEATLFNIVLMQFLNKNTQRGMCENHHFKPEMFR